MPRVRLRTIGAATVVLVAVLSGCSGNQQQNPAPAAAPRSGSVWVADEGHDSITVIDAATNAVTMT
ncbi:MAG TPA: hypothetical protein P5544_18325, partial [Candidatus Nanopelagicales bacterium]|nr:hypothetical protein [Candidatus Nanopelagicales bacterium]